MRTRKVFVALYEGGLRIAMWANMPVRMPFRRVLEQLIALNNRPEEGETEADNISEAGEFSLYSWRQDPIPTESLIVEIPKPGIVLAVHRDTAQAIGSSSDFGVVIQLRRALERGEGKAAERLQRFLKDEDADFEPLPFARFDVFVSYSTPDLTLARKLVDGMEQRGLRCFLSSRSLEAGQLWQEEIRQALVESRVAVLLLTQASIRSSWVMCEAGACWALGKTIVPALVGVDARDAPEIISGYQCRLIGNAAGRKRMLDELKALCLGSEEDDDSAARAASFDVAKAKVAATIGAIQTGDSQSKRPRTRQKSDRPPSSP